MDLAAYLEAAKARQNITSDAQLARRLGLPDNGVSFYRRRGILPSDETMAALAVLAGVDPGEALLDLNVWRSKSERVRGLYESLRRAATAAALALFIVAGFGGTNGAQAAVVSSPDIHYAYCRYSCPDEDGKPHGPPHRGIGRLVCRS